MENTTAEVLKALSALEGDLATKFEKMADRIGNLEISARKDAFNQSGAAGAGSVAVRKAIQSFTDSDQFKALQAGTTRNVAVDVQVVAKSLTSLQGSPGSPPTGYPVHPEREAGLWGNAYRPLTLLDVLPARPTTSNSVGFVQMQGYTSAADAQDFEGAPKAEQNIDPALREAAVETVAVYINVSKQVLSDVAELRGELEQLLGHGVRAKSEAHIVNGTGGQQRILGLVPQAQQFVHLPTMPAVDRIGACAATVGEEGYVPNLVVVNPRDWFDFISERASGGDEQYIGPGWSVPAGQSIYQMPVVATPSLMRGRALVIDTAFVRIADREQVTISAGFTGDNFTKNILTLLVEMRLGLVVRDPRAVNLVDLTDGGSP